MTHQFFISCQIGFEEMVKNELLHLLTAEYKLANPQEDAIPLRWDFASPEEQQQLYTTLSQKYAIKIKVGGISAKLELYQAYQFILWSRIAARTLLVLNTAYVETDLDLYNAIYAQNWLEILHQDFDFKVNFNGSNEFLKNSQYSALRVKDALVDYFQNKNLPRPNVNTDEPDVLLDCRLHNNQLQLSLDLTGSMNKRYRSRAGFAPMRETLAANLILRTSWDKESPVYNPMCGSGVLAIEAALIALNIAPGLFCQHHLDFWRQHDVDTWLKVSKQAKDSQITPAPNFKVYASDSDRHVLIVAKMNAEIVGVEAYIDFQEQELKALKRTEASSTGLVIVNPPYGVRLANERALYDTYFTLGQTLKSLFPGWICGVISSSTKLLDVIGLSANRKWEIKNSNLDCQFRVYSIRSLQATSVNTQVETDQATQALYNRLGKNFARLKSYLTRNQIQNYRLYDADIPEFNVAVDVYTDAKTQTKYYVVQEYAASKKIPLHKTVKRSIQALSIVQRYATDQVKNEYQPLVIDKLRERQKGDSQYNRLTKEGLEFYIDEYDCKVKVNLTDYIDTGIFLDNRELRYFLRSLVIPKKTKFLNLFSYTSTATLHVIKAQAAFTKSVDMSKNYCLWSAHNFKLNQASAQTNKIVQADVLAWLEAAQTNTQELNTYDLIFCDPPTFSNSKRMEGTFDVQRDHVQLISKIANLLKAQGSLVFCNNKRGFKLDQQALVALGLEVTDITQKTMPQDFAGSKIHQAWLLKKL
ncbi:bifunctional 23S rRNA (guanine(2069)-N(7))-methyltransferase RlmK/23S rRNA (guanine(2445)-N(2))-methyltransferase RlmL [Psittacicella gerlachiana]|uniref:23S rRNA (Guanine(2445)-N(2))/(Guanine(2069)-N(7))-methyltransferase n=1 Tax=Psittacicella gerlachiana TaxID=2028574 RepID=A0A3A1YLX3_9GAMM|nr:bifunctional 23S rRNA (guanine(2069)-N(7))-methyltransferase RlmK/23S rRNA (guanine(2445)-N(2))-methyltransferase RlmL [Psittacicella gerlachiana]RIY38466.1 23S rRNA (guanine(2445)-N(2))/(guanine(2069)-N(7))-methyltransferase [Psittacicella gerlachiana]